MNYSLLNRMVYGLLAFLVFCSGQSGVCLSARSAPKEYLVYVGTYTGQKSKGIYAYRLQMESGQLVDAGLAVETGNPSFLAIHPKKNVVYAANEVGRFEGKPSGAVSAFSIDPGTGKLTLMNHQPSGGGGPCHVSVDKSGRVVFVANYGGGSIASYPVKDDGSLGETASFIQHKGTSVNRQRQEAPHAHCIGVDPGNRFVYAADLGLDKLMIYKFDTRKGTLTENDPAFGSVVPGAGARHFDFTPNGKFCYVINEINCTITAFQHDARRGGLKELQTESTLPVQRDPKYSTAEIAVHPSGKFVYGSNRGHDSIAVFSIDQRSGRLTLVEHQPSGGKTPRSFGIDPTGTWFLSANQSSDNIVVFRIDPASGGLTRTATEVKVGAPVSVAFFAAK